MAQGVVEMEEAALEMEHWRKPPPPSNLTWQHTPPTLMPAISKRVPVKTTSSARFRSCLSLFRGMKPYLVSFTSPAAQLIAIWRRFLATLRGVHILLSISESLHHTTKLLFSNNATRLTCATRKRATGPWLVPLHES